MQIRSDIQKRTWVLSTSICKKKKNFPRSHERFCRKKKHLKRKYAIAQRVQSALVATEDKKEKETCVSTEAAPYTEQSPLSFRLDRQFANSNLPTTI